MIQMSHSFNFTERITSRPGSTQIINTSEGEYTKAAMPSARPILYIAPLALSLLYVLNNIKKMKSIKVLASNGAEKTFHSGKSEVTSIYDMAGRYVCF